MGELDHLAYTPHPQDLLSCSPAEFEVLDVAAEHPVGFDASYVWVFNSHALRLSGITRETPNPPGGTSGFEA